jgi:hypothetical protein
MSINDLPPTWAKSSERIGNGTTRILDGSTPDRLCPGYLGNRARRTKQPQGSGLPLAKPHESIFGKRSQNTVFPDAEPDGPGWPFARYGGFNPQLLAAIAENRAILVFG